MKMKFDKKRGLIRMSLDERSIYDYFELNGFIFPEEIITRYLLSLKTKPFVILTGISGTGKTKIAQVFAEYMCQDDIPDEREKRIAFISVRPDWMDNKGLLGYYNILDEKYYATSLLKLLLNARQNPDKPYFVILDEMNLAKVEQYFSDFLSIMESRTPNNPDGESMELFYAENAKTHDGTPIPSKLHIPANVYFTGTVNVDESTYMFSPKVLDRANVIEFNDVNLKQYSSSSDKAGAFLLKDTDVRRGLIDKTHSPFCSREDYYEAEKIIGKEITILQDMLNILHPYNLHFGYRVVNEVSRFIINTKDMVKKFDINETLDVQILQKVLPKFHGSQAKLEEPLKRLLKFCWLDQTVSGDSFVEADIENVIQNGHMRFPRSARKLARMIRNLKVQGYTSFIE